MTVLFSIIKHLMTGCVGNCKLLLSLCIPTIALGFASSNSWYLRDNKLAITLTPSQ